MGNRQIFLGPLSFDDVTGVIALQKEARLALDGQIISSTRLNNIPPEAVFVIDVIGGDRAVAVYGYPYVITIITKNDEIVEKALLKAQDIGMQQIVHPGFYQAKTFYRPNYENKALSPIEKDIRSTLHWQPNIRTENQPINFDFYTGDVPGNYLIWVEGISKDGIPFTAEKTFLVEN